MVLPPCSPVRHLGQGLSVFLCLALLLAGCSTSDHQSVTAPTAASSQSEQQAIDNLLDLYRQALTKSKNTVSVRLIEAMSKRTTQNPCMVHVSPTRTGGVLMEWEDKATQPGGGPM